jgi:hypothetical protein
MIEAPTFPAALRQELERSEERRLSIEEFDARANAPMSDHEREDFHALVRWFTTRYPTAGDRMRVIRGRVRRLNDRRRSLARDRP